MSDTGFTSTTFFSEDKRNAQLEEVAQFLDRLSGNAGPSGTLTPSEEGETIRLFKNDEIKFGSKPHIWLISEENIPPRAPQVITTAQLAQEYNFYYVPIPVRLKTESNWLFNELTLNFVFSSVDAPSDDQPKAYLMYPEEKLDVKETPAKLSAGTGTMLPISLGGEINLTLRKSNR